MSPVREGGAIEDDEEEEYDDDVSVVENSCECTDFEVVEILVVKDCSDCLTHVMKRGDKVLSEASSRSLTSVESVDMSTDRYDTERSFLEFSLIRTLMHEGVTDERCF